MPANYFVDVTVGDLNGDGRPELVFSDSDYGGTIGFIYWGQPGGTYGVQYSTSHRTDLPAYYAVEAAIGDLNGDGRPEVVFATRGGSSSFIYWGQPGGTYGVQYSPSARTDLPTNNAWGIASLQGASAAALLGGLDSPVMDSGQPGAVWAQVTATTQILSASTGITLFVAASDNLAALNNPTWVQIGAMSNGSWSQSLSGVTGRYARYRVQLWRSSPQATSPALQDITFTYATIPTQTGFTKSAPSNGAVNQPTSNLNLSWSTVSGATRYEVCFDTAVNGACGGSWQNVNLSTTLTLNGLTPGVQYEWQVRACNIAGCNAGADNGQWWTFTTASGPQPFSKHSPASGATNQPINLTLTWQNATGQGTVTYDYCLKTSTPCTASDWISAGTSTSATANNLQAGTTYYWQVRACDANGGSG